MIRSLLIGLSAGARSMTPLAAVSNAARSGALPADNGAPAWLGHPLVTVACTAIALGELLGDKLRSAPDRIVLAGIATRVASGGLAGAALVPRKRAVAGALLGATAAVGAAYITFSARRGAMRRFGQTSTGLLEDALTIGAAQLVTSGARQAR